MQRRYHTRHRRLGTPSRQHWSWTGQLKANLRGSTGSYEPRGIYRPIGTVQDCIQGLAARHHLVSDRLQTMHTTTNIDLKFHHVGGRIWSPG
jgi:hypothetical protein